jgi:hypothetical protein
MKKKIKNKVIYILLIVIITFGVLIYRNLYSAAQHGKALAKLTVVITGEDGDVIPDADASVTFDLMAGWTESRNHAKKGKSNEQGEFSATYRTLDKVFVGARKENYYYSNKQVKFKNTKGIKWQPWNPTVEVVLRREVNPIPLYAKHYLSLDIPVSNKDVGYDFLLGDWIEPYGNGKSTNVIMNFSYRIENKYNYQWKLEVRMNSEFEGFQSITNVFSNSIAKLPFIAPVDSYSKSIIYKKKYLDGKRVDKDSIEPLVDNFFFRINSGTNSFCYGKLVRFEPHISRDGGYINFSYYLNPTPNDRNIEFNTKSNLFQNLDRSERVSSP